MNIILLCASMEPGRDGVGDYTRRLAANLQNRNHSVLVVALHDKFLQDISVLEQDSEGISVPVVRVPATMPAKQRINYLAQLHQVKQADWVSIQFVNFGFNKYGLPFELLKLPGVLNAKIKFHIMFHELWCGMGVSSGLKEKVLGQAQKLFIKAFIYALKPSKIFTSIVRYGRFLNTIGQNAGIVPIYSNISVNAANETELQSFINSGPLAEVIRHQSELLILGFFGTIYNCPGLWHLLESAGKAAASLNKKLFVLNIGHNRNSTLLDDVGAKYYYQTGSVSPETINGLMKLVNVGVVTTPADSIDKSGTAIAWLERSTPVLIPAADQTYQPVQKERGIYQAQTHEDILQAIQYKAQNRNADPVTEVADVYLKNFEAANHGK